MILALLLGAATLVVTLGIQAAAVVVMLRWLIGRLSVDHEMSGFLPETRILSVVLILLFIGHVLQIAIWALLFFLVGEFAEFTTAFYHSTVNFASLGYGDIVMSEHWRLLGALEAANGVLMFGLSASTMFMVMTQLYQRHSNVQKPGHLGDG